MHVADAFSRADLEAIEIAVREAEVRSAGEIVPYAVDHSDRYGEAAWTAAAFGGLLTALVAAVLYDLAETWVGHPVLWIAFPPLAGAALGYLVAALPAIRRRLVPADVLEHRVRQRALAAFVEQEVFRTRDRTGILLFLSLLERRVVVLADSGITARVAQAEWDAIVAEIVAGMRRGDAGPALAAGIRGCADLLAAHGLPNRPGVPDELSDQLRRGPE